MAMRHPVVVIVLIVAAQHLLTLGSRDLWWSDEVRQANVLQYLVNHGHWVALRLNDLPYPDKPPLYFWFMGALAQIAGSTSPSVIFFGLAVTVAFFGLCTYAFARLLDLSKPSALLSAIILLTGFYVIALSHYARMDYMFAGLIALAWGAFYRGVRLSEPNRWIILGFVAASAANMTKGPFGFLLPIAALVAFAVITGRARNLLRRDMAIGLAILAATSLAWVAGIVLAEGFDYLRTIFAGQIVGRSVGNAGNPLGYLQYFVLLPLLFLPWTPMLIIGGRKAEAELPEAGQAPTFLWTAAVTGMLILSAVGEKHEYYLLPILIPLSIIAAMRLVAASPASRRLLWTIVAATMLTVAVLPPIIVLFLPYASSIAAASLAGAILAGVAYLLWSQRHARLAVPLAIIAIGHTIWGNAISGLFMPSLDHALSPATLAREVQLRMDEGYAPATFSMTGGDLAYYLDAPYREGFTSPTDVGTWMEGQDRVVLATPQAAWDTLAQFSQGMEIVARVPLAGDTIIVAVTRPVD